MTLTPSTFAARPSPPPKGIERERETRRQIIRTYLPILSCFASRIKSRRRQRRGSNCPAFQPKSNPGSPSPPRTDPRRRDTDSILYLGPSLFTNRTPSHHISRTPPSPREKERQRETGLEAAHNSRSHGRRREAASDAAGAHNHDSTTPAASLYRRHPASRCWSHRLVVISSVLSSRRARSATQRRATSGGRSLSEILEGYGVSITYFVQIPFCLTTTQPLTQTQPDTIPVLVAPRLPALSANPPGLPSDDGPHRRPSAPAIQASLP